MISSKKEKRIQAQTHLLSAIMHIEAAMVIDADNWDHIDLQDARDGRDTVRNLVDTFKKKAENVEESISS